MLEFLKLTGAVKEVHDRNFLKLKIRKMYKKNTLEGIWKWEKHNVLYFIQANELTEFTVEEFCKKATGSRYRWYGYYDRVISDLLLELLKEGKLKVFYISQGGKTVASYSRNS